ncbi:MAG TPA: hypothetical protein VM577_02785, partial [Anaerovoracaceae bacterium]|nr:hypothetical protein [Anaerovoracaceae bacterium]
ISSIFSLTSRRYSFSDNTTASTCLEEIKQMTVKASGVLAEHYFLKNFTENDVGFLSHNFFPKPHFVITTIHSTCVDAVIRIPKRRNLTLAKAL